MIVIVASILAAFALDAWWDRRRDIREANAIHDALAAEFQTARVEVAFSLKRNQRVIAAADTLLLKLRRATRPVDVPVGTIAVLFLAPTTDPRQGTLEALIGSGRLDLLGDATLQGLLANWPAVLIDVREEELAAREFVQKEFIPFLSQTLDLSTPLQWRLSEYQAVLEGDSIGTKSSLPDETQRLSPSRGLINMIERRRYLASFALISSSKLTRMLAQINRELAN